MAKATVSKKSATSAARAKQQNDTKRHGKAAALALWIELEKTDAHNYGEPGRLDKTRKTLAA